MPIVRKFIEWLSYHPSSEEIARALATDYLSEFGVLGIRFGRVNSDSSINLLGQYGYSDACENRVIESSEWRSIDAESVKIISGESKVKCIAFRFCP